MTKHNHLECETCHAQKNGRCTEIKDVLGMREGLLYPTSMGHLCPRVSGAPWATDKEHLTVGGRTTRHVWLDEAEPMSQEVIDAVNEHQGRKQ